jgi:hypothetical protein
LRILSDRRDDLFVRPQWRWKSNDYRVRCLLRLMRTDDALREAQAVAKREYGNRVLLVLAHATAGDVKQTIAVVEKPRPQPYFLKTCYQDEDLGPLLRSEPFEAFRKKFPEPKEEELRGAPVGPPD